MVERYPSKTSLSFFINLIDTYDTYNQIKSEEIVMINTNNAANIHSPLIPLNFNKSFRISPFILESGKEKGNLSTRTTLFLIIEGLLCITLFYSKLLAH